MNADRHLIAIRTAVIAGKEIQKNPGSRDGAQDEEPPKNNPEPDKVFRHSRGTGNREGRSGRRGAVTPRSSESLTANRLITGAPPRATRVRRSRHHRRCAR